MTVNNLIGDAISFSGRTETMVAMARDVRRHFAAYSARLQREITQRRAREAAGGDRARARGAHRGGGPRDAEAQARGGRRRRPGSARPAAAQYRLARANEDEARMTEERDKALARARGEAISAGIFVSFGPAPLVVAIDDEVFGRQRVAIADKINESARGTASNGAARARADAELAAERKARGAPRAGARLARLHRAAAHDRHPAGPEAAEASARSPGANHPLAMRHVAGPVRAALEVGGQGRGGRARGHLQQRHRPLGGVAAGLARQRSRAPASCGAWTSAPDAVPEELRARWYYGTDPLNLVACFGGGGRLAELYRRVGRAAFKGLGDVVVWELCEEMGGAAALAQHYGPGWFKEARG